MELEELKQVLEQTNIPTYYGQSLEEQQLPYIVYVVAYSNNFIADGKVYKKIEHIDCSLYTGNKNIELENTLEEVLNQNGIVHSKREYYLAENKVYQIIYEFEI